MTTLNLTAAQRADAELGMAWWNGLTKRERCEWMERAGNTGVVADAWVAFKNYDPTPYCSYGHRTKASCDCGPIADND